MIGLGSNRLTIARRGGMSVTQAGRGGMELLLGGRGALGASPYSAQATAALKRNFPSYWNDIMQYGLRNPNMVPLINEDPMLICSVGLQSQGVDLPIRWLQSVGDENGNGKCWIDTGIYFNKPVDYEIEFVQDIVVNWKRYLATKDLDGGFKLYNSGTTLSINNNGSERRIETTRAGSVYSVKKTGNNFVVKRDGTQIWSGSIGSNFTMSSNELQIFMGKEGSSPVGRIKQHMVLSNTDRTTDLVPFISATRNGLLDLNRVGVEGNEPFMLNAGSENFTDAYTLQDGVTPWSPS